jgi:hypothetical protein
MELASSPVSKRPAVSPWSRLLVALVVPVVVIVGVWAVGGQVTDDFRVAMALTGVWLAGAGAAALLVGLRRRALMLPVLGSFVVAAGAVGAYLGWTTLRDTVVNEAVAVASPASGNVLRAAGAFTSDAHETTGTASVIELATGGDRLVLDLETSPGPDLRVYLVPGDGRDVGDHRDLGALKGNKGRQQYELPAGTDTARYRTVVIWCRAFSVSFGRAVLEPKAAAS